MRTFKNWKSELKKKGAMALTAFMLCGSAGTAFAQITIHDGETGDIASAGEPTPGDVKTVTGYQTDKAVGYAANITWGNMLFVYDRGTYDPSSGRLIGSFQDSRDDIEINGDKSQAGYWYGFDGENNAVEIKNLSTEKVKLTATPTVTNDNDGAVEFRLYVENSDSKGWEDASSDVGSYVNHNVLSGDSSGAPNDNRWIGGEINSPISRVFDARTFDNNGTADKTDSDVIYLNITGRPADGFMNATTYNSNTPKVGDELGNITLGFSIAETGNILTADNGDN